MKTKIMKYVIVSILFLLAIFSTETVHAEEYTGHYIKQGEYISNIYIKKVQPSGYTKYQQAGILRTSHDNQFVYCLQPYVSIDNNPPYYTVIRDDYQNVLGLTQEQWDRITLLAYYGYGYNENGYDHSEVKWEPITQVLIWRTTNPESDIFFTDTLNGNRIVRFEEEMAELNALVANHYKTPKFNDNVTIPIGQTITLNDLNYVLKDYKISSTSNVNASITNNELNITPTGIGDGVINLEKKATKYEIPPVVYFSNHSQNVMRVGTYDPVKTKLALALAKEYQAIIVNADAMQVYQGLNIGTAKVKPEERENIPHLLFDIRQVNEEYNVFNYQHDLRQVLADYQNQNIILVGGTGLYIKAGLYDYQFGKQVDNHEDEQMTNETLYEQALKKDPALTIHPHNRQRLINKPRNETTEIIVPKPLYDFKMIGLTTSREQLYERINNRVEQMINEGLIEEARGFYEAHNYSKPLIKGIGYKELYQYFAGEITKDEAIALIKKNSRHYAKRQYTWFNNQFNVTWFTVDFNDFDNTIKAVKEYLKKEV